MRIFNDTIEQGHGASSSVLAQRLRARLARTGQQLRHFSDDEIAAVYAAYHDMLAKWTNLPSGGRLNLNW